MVSNDVSLSLASQKTEEIKQPTDFINYKDELVSLKGKKNYHLSLGQYYTAAKITTLDSSHNPLIVTTNNKEYSIGMDPSLANDKEAVGSFIVFTTPQKQIILQAEENANIKLELFYAPPVDLPRSKYKTKKEACEKPHTVPQSEWRVGLPRPKPGRNATVVKHCIIHHSAGSNTDTNYVNILRNIYLLHTKSNGWDDIGYNYIIAQDGTIFSGRQAEESIDEDNTQGAHFCAKNTGTMGICLLGNYNTVSPSKATQSSLKNLLTWKLNKERISALDFYPHPNSFGEELSTISMHRNGCPTACPGDSTALILDKIREDVQSQLDKCGDVVSIEPAKTIEKRVHLMIYPNPSDGRFFVMVNKEAKIERYQMINFTGKTVSKGTLAPNGYIKTDVVDGTYTLQLWSKNDLKATHKIIIRRE